MVTLVLREQRNKRIIRSFLVGPSASLEVVRLKESGRLELVHNTKKLTQQGVDFESLDRIVPNKIADDGHRVTPHVELAKGDPKGMTTHLQEVDPEGDDRVVATAFKWSTVGHLGAVALSILLAWILQTYFQTETKPETLTVLAPQQTERLLNRRITPTPPVPRVRMAENQRQMRQEPRNRVVSQRLIRTEKRVNTVQRPTGVRQGPVAEVGTLQALDRLGGVGSTASGPRRGSGFGDSASGVFGSGSGTGGGLGAGRSGGLKNALGGKGLVAGLSGQGSQSFGAQGYGDGKNGGGRAGRGGGSVGSRVGDFNQILVPAFDDSEIVGGLTREQVDSVVEKNKGQLRFCFEQALQSTPDLRGRISTKWVIDPQGEVKALKMTGSSLASAQVENCVTRSIRNWRFPKPVGGVTVDVFYPFDFGRTNWVRKEG
jgi:hypothetical protein